MWRDHENDEWMDDAERDEYRWMDRAADVCLLLVAVGIVGALIAEGVRRAWA